MKNIKKKDAVSSYMVEQIERFKQIWTGLRLCIGKEKCKKEEKNFHDILLDSSM